MKNLIFLMISICLCSFSVLAQGDNCADAIELSCGDVLTGQVGSADNSDDLPTSCIGSMGAPVWYTFVGTGDNVTIEAIPNGWDAEIGVFDAACGAADGTTCVVGADDPELVTFPTTPGTVYLIAVGNFIQGSPSDVFDISVACEPPPPICPDGFVEVSNSTYCYDSNEADVIVTEACPSSPTETVCITVQVGDWESGFDDVTFYQGAMGSGTGGTIVSGPSDGDISGTQVCSTVPGECITWVSNSDGSVSCVSGARPTAEFTICETEAVVAVCDVTITPPAAANLCDPDGATGAVFPLDPAACTGADGPVGTGFVYDVYVYTPGGAITGAAAPAGYENTAIPPAAEFPDPLMDGNLTAVRVDQICGTPVDPIGLINPTCEPATFTFLYFPFDYALDSDGNTVAEYPTDCAVVRVDHTIYPTLVAEVLSDDAANCGDVVIELYSSGGSANGGTVCNTATVTCATDGMATSFTFADVLDAAGAAVPIVENPDGSCNTLMAAGGACAGCGVTTDCPLNPTAFGTGTAPALSAGCDGTPIINTYTTCTFPGEFNTVSGLIPGEEYCFTQQDVDVAVDGYITIYASDGVTVLASGVSPVCFVATDTDVFVNLNLNDGMCGVESTCYESSVQCMTCAAPSCSSPNVLTAFPCYGDNLVDEVVLEVCPTNPGDVVSVDIFETDIEAGFDNVTIYSGTPGSGTGGTVIVGPIDGDVSGTYVGNPGECVIFVVNSDGSVSCDSGARPAGCYCAPPLPDCEADNGTLNIKGIPGGN